MRTKKTVVLLLAVLFVLSLGLFGCGEKTPPPEPVDDSTVHMYLIGGQSNGVGISPIATAKTADLSKTFDNVSYAGETDYNVNTGSPLSSFGLVATKPSGTPTASYSSGFVNVRSGLGRESRHIGPEYGMAEVLDGLYSGARKAFIFKSAAGGTSVRNQTVDVNAERYGNWQCPSLIAKLPSGEVDAKRTGALYKRFIENFRAVYENLTGQLETVKVKGMIWMQGESDRESAEVIAAYPEILGALIKDLREDLCEITGDQSLMKMPFIAGEISDTHNSALPATVAVNRSFNLMLNNLGSSGAINDFHVVTAHDMPQNELKGGASVSLGEDIWHWIADYEVELGRRFADKLLECA